MRQSTLFDFLDSQVDLGSKRPIDLIPYSPSIALEIGKAAEHLVCADLILKGYRAFLSDQGLPYDVVVDLGDRFVRIQVKATLRPKNPAPKTRLTRGYFFHVRRAGKNGRRRYPPNAFDIFALVALDLRAIAYLRSNDTSLQTITLRVPGLDYHNTNSPGRDINEETFERAIRSLRG